MVGVMVRYIADQFLPLTSLSTACSRQLVKTHSSEPFLNERLFISNEKKLRIMATSLNKTPAYIV